MLVRRAFAAFQGMPERKLRALRRWGARGLLLGILALVTGLNAAHFERYPFPPASQHRAFTLVPRLVRYFQGYELFPPHGGNLEASRKSYALASREPIAWHNPATVVQNRASAEKADTADDIRGDAGRLSVTAELEREDCKERRADADKDDRSEARGLVAEFALNADESADEDCQQQLAHILKQDRHVVIPFCAVSNGQVAAG